MNYREDIYDKLAERYKQPGFKHFRDVLQAMMTPEEGEIVLALADRMTPS